MQVIPWNEQEPGHLEVDLVWHCGQSTHGDFVPVMRLQEKISLPAQGPRSTLKRRYDTPQTPFQRLCATGLLAEPVQSAIQELQRALNPHQLRRMILQLVEEIKAMPSARPDEHQMCS